MIIHIAIYVIELTLPVELNTERERERERRRERESSGLMPSVTINYMHFTAATPLLVVNISINKNTPRDQV